MNENHALFAIVGAVVAVGLIGMYMTYEPNKITGLNPYDEGRVDLTVNSAVTIEFTIPSTSINTGEPNCLAGDTIRFDTEGNCINARTGEVCPDYATTGKLEFATGGNTQQSTVIDVSSTSPFGLGSSVKAKIWGTSPGYPNADCNLMQSYTTLTSGSPVDIIEVANPGRVFELHAQFEYLCGTPPGDTSVAFTVTGTETVATEASCEFVPVP